MKIKIIVLGLMLLSGCHVAAPESAHSHHSQAADVNAAVMKIRYQEILSATQGFYQTLTPQQQKALIQPFEHPYRTRNFCYVLAHCKTEYVGLRMRDLQAWQKYALNQLLMKVLSGEGYLRVVGTMNREWLLQEMENAYRADPKHYPVIGSPEVPNWTPPLQRGAEDYYLAIFGQPGSASGWAIRFEGHHLTLNATYGEKDGQLMASVTPMFFGASPMAVPKAPSSKIDYPHWHAQEGQQSLQREAWLARSLLRTFSVSQRELSQWNQLPKAELMGGTDAPLDAVHYLKGQRPGQAIADLSATQQALLWDFIESFLLTQNSHAVPWELVKQDLHQGHVWWFGDVNNEQAPLYVRVQSPRYLVELLQANTFGVRSDIEANHVHASFRDLKSDWDFDVLGDHLKTQHHHK
jgi:hypothetical protein